MAVTLDHRFELVARLGQGGQGVVYLARDRHVDREVALKLLAPGVQWSSASDEFAALRSLSHRSLATAFDIGTLDEPFEGRRLFLTSEYIQGLSAQAFVEEARDPLARNERVLELALQLASALSAIHDLGWLHGDVKPDNVLVEAGPRAVLLDLGLAVTDRARLLPGIMRGTLRYAAPEVLSGAGDARSDLYGLGTVLFEAAAGTAPFPLADAPSLVRSIAAGRRAAIAEAAPWVDAEVAALVEGLLATDAEKRPSSSQVVIEHVRRIREALGLPVLGAAPQALLSEPPFVGREELVQTLVARLESRAPVVVQVVGPAGFGRTRVIEQALRQVSLRALAAGEQPPTCLRGDLDEILDSLAIEKATAQERMEALADRLRRPALGREAPVPAILFLRGCDDELSRQLLRVLAVESLPVCCIASAQSAVLGVGEPFELAPFGLAELRDLCERWTGQPADQRWIRRCLELTAGHPQSVIELVRFALSTGGLHGEPGVGLPVDDVLAGILLQRVSRLDPPLVSIVEVLAVAGQPITVLELSELVGVDRTETRLALGKLVAGGLVREAAGRFRLASTLHERVLDAAIPAPRRKALHRQALRITSSSPLQNARHLLVTGPAKAALPAALAAMDEQMSLGRAQVALELGKHALEVLPGDTDLGARTAEIALAVGDYELARECATPLRRARKPEMRERMLTVLAECHRFAGQLEEATELLASLVSQQPEAIEPALSLARLELADGQLAVAETRSLRAATSDRAAPEQKARALEIAGLASLYGGRPQPAQERFEAILQLARSEENLRLEGRALGLQSLLAQRAGQIAEAARLAELAASLSASAGARHASAVFELNLATIEQRRARYAAALDALGRALVGLARVGSPAELAAAHFNRGHLLVLLGELDSAEQSAGLAHDCAEAARDPRFAMYAEVLRGDIARRRYELDRAQASYEAALETARTRELADRHVAAMCLAELLAQRRDPRALKVLREIEVDSEEHRQLLLLCRARVHLDLSWELGSLAEELARQRDEMTVRGETDLAWRLAILCARCYRSIGKIEQGADALVVASRLVAEVVGDTPEAYRAGLRRDPDLQALSALEADLALTRSDSRAAPLGEGPLRRLLRLGRRLNSELRLEALLDDVIDTAIELGDAERGFLLLRDSGGALSIAVARHIDRATLAGEPGLSRSIAERVVLDGEVILTTNAEDDIRFGGSESIAALQLRSILCVPLRVKAKVVGAMYLDHRFRDAAFGDRAVEILRELADIAAVAIENARLADENRRRQHEIDELNRSLAARLENAEAELVVAKARLEETPRLGKARGLVGGSAAMREVLLLVERAAACDLPVVIEGESGTGKELVARAIHANSDRADGPFVAINCGAVPETLLEAELFGYRRGAFTGAERSRKGLFEAASGGTLFLDEIADTSLAMQSKLLRVVQEGEVRPLGAEHGLQVNVRVLSASNQDLEELVERGRFREDLFYRLHVLKVAIAPLRERTADIPELVAHLLERLAPGRELKVSAAALRQLALHSWPGNVRELENELARAIVMCDGSELGPEHLSLRRAAVAAVEPVQDELELKPQVEALERRQIEKAMSSFGGNQTRAAEALGLSRYGLQKKLRRYGLGGG